MLKAKKLSEAEAGALWTQLRNHDRKTIETRIKSIKFPKSDKFLKELKNFPAEMATLKGIADRLKKDEFVAVLTENTEGMGPVKLSPAEMSALPGGKNPCTALVHGGVIIDIFVEHETTGTCDTFYGPNH